jgi:hypothetical protein
MATKKKQAVEAHFEATPEFNCKLEVNYASGNFEVHDEAIGISHKMGTVIDMADNLSETLEKLKTSGNLSALVELLVEHVALVTDNIRSQARDSHHAANLILASVPEWSGDYPI